MNSDCATMFTRHVDGTRLELQRDERWAESYRIDRIGPGLAVLCAQNLTRAALPHECAFVERRPDKQRMKLPAAVVRHVGADVLVVVDSAHDHLWLLRAESAVDALAQSVQAWPGVATRGGSQAPS